MSWRQPILRGRDEGAVALETALILTVMMLLLLGIIEFSVAWWQLNSMSLAVAHAGRHVMLSYAKTNPAPTACDTTCAEGWMQQVLTTATVCASSPPSGLTADQTCVIASLKTNNGTAGMTLTASYGFNFAGIRGTLLPLSSGIWVPLD
jgi:Flp pilus assembly protein TadG